MFFFQLLFFSDIHFNHSRSFLPFTFSRCFYICFSYFFRTKVLVLNVTLFSFSVCFSERQKTVIYPESNTQSQLPLVIPPYETEITYNERIKNMADTERLFDELTEEKKQVQCSTGSMFVLFDHCLRTISRIRQMCSQGACLGYWVIMERCILYIFLKAAIISSSWSFSDIVIKCLLYWKLT